MCTIFRRLCPVKIVQKLSKSIKIW